MAETQCTEFHRFSSLPPEIRRQIWEYVVEQPHVVHTQGFIDDWNVIEDKETVELYQEDHVVDHVDTQWIDTDENRLRVYPRFPPVHDVCHEARKAFLESPGLVSEETGLGVAWHPERDILMCHDLVDGYRAGRGRWQFSWWDVIGHEWMPVNCNARKNPEFPGRHDVRHLRFDFGAFQKAYPVAIGTYSRHPPEELIFDVFENGEQVAESLVDRFPNAETFEVVMEEEDAEYMASRSHAMIGATFEFPSPPARFGYNAWNIFNFLRKDWGFATIKGRMLFALA
ncbi:hypothetical protein PG991_012083 [Apiospora marii]|uniref:2EXR domain-containing protein n=1 Tax=Apiospora marii TaxID=335849 RepID=A0ABR1RFY8_9PEZI